VSVVSSRAMYIEAIPWEVNEPAPSSDRYVEHRTRLRLSTSSYRYRSIVPIATKDVHQSDSVSLVRSELGRYTHGRPHLQTSSILVSAPAAHRLLHIY